MFDVNVKIISELKNFVAIVGSHREILEKFCISSHDFVRRRKIPFDKLVLLVSKLCKKTLSVELETFFQEIGSDLNCSVSAFVQQRLKLEPMFFYYWNMVLQRSFYHYYGTHVKRWKGFRVIAADGSSISLVDTSSLRQYFGGQGNQYSRFIGGRTFFHYDVLNELILLAWLRPYREGELNMAYDAVHNLEEDMLAIYDRNFSYYKLVALHCWQEQERKFVIRAKESQKMIRSFLRSGKKSSVEHMRPSKAAITGLKKSGFIITPETLLKVRLVRVDLKHSTEVLLTNLWEDEGYTVDQFKDLYFLRWGIETNIGTQKNILQLESFSGLNPQSVLQDFYATMVVLNLHSILIKNAQLKVDQSPHRGKYPMKVNKNKSFGRLKINLIALFIKNDIQSILDKLYTHFAREVVPIRKGRTFLRRRKNTHSKSRNKTYTNFKPAY